MEADEVNWYRWALAMAVTGLGLAFLLWLGFYWPNRATGARPPREFEEFPRGLRVAGHPIPAVLKWGYLIMALVIVGYTIYTVIAHVNY